MRIVEISVLLVAVAFALLATYLVPVLIQLRKTVTMSEQLLAILKRDVPQLLRELRALSHQVNDLTQQVRGGVEHAVVLLYAVGEVGSSVKQVHGVVKGSGDSMVTQVTSVVAGLKAATNVLTARFRSEGGQYNGG